MTSPAPNPVDCPCDLSGAYLHCCGRWHAGPLHLQAPDAALLMRSRYSAFVLQRVDYLLDTWHPQARPGALEPLAPDVQWLGLEVRRHAPIDASRATVEFVARYRQGGRATSLHEISRFEKVEGRWTYLDGAFPQKR